MRYLNKIIFINSAHIPYSEILLDGNVHFIGTQGVGKSTLLRAILFFYNADKSRLGIQREQKTFDEFYLPGPDSYIVYEVARENGRFFVMTFVSQGRSVFRFIDCPFDRRFLINDDGSVHCDWGKISQTIGASVFKSNIIRAYSDFRDIIYGNSQDRQLRRFSIMESQKYQNVPRTIQNIFLNQSLESRMIKNTIIDSMDFADDSIDLNFFREQVKDFKQRYEDIWKWYKKEKNGRIKVQTEAESVLKAYTDYQLIIKSIDELSGQLNYAIDRDKAELPALENNIRESQGILSTKERLLSEESAKFQSEQKKLNGDISVLNYKLKTAKERHLHYEAIQMDSILQRSKHESELRIRRDATQKQMDSLTDKNRDVKVRYDELKSNNANLLQQTLNRISERINLFTAGFNTEVNVLNDEKNKKHGTMEIHFKELTDGVNDLIHTAEEEKHDLDLKRIKLTSMNPYQQAMDELNGNIDKLTRRQNELQLMSLNFQKHIERITHDVELNRKKTEAECDSDLIYADNDIAQLRSQTDKLQNLLDRQKGSLIEWLGENVDDWEKNIGKVLDEDSVLYNTSLHPRKSGLSDNIYGIVLDTENIESKIRTPKEIEAEKSELETHISTLNRQKISRKEKRDADIAAMERKPQAELKGLRIKMADCDAELRSVPTKIGNLNRDLDALNDKLAIFRKKEYETVKKSLMRVEGNLNLLCQKKKEIFLDKKREEDKLNKDFTHRRNALQKELDANKNLLKEENKKAREETVRKNIELDAHMDAELRGLGMDVNVLANLRHELRQLSEELHFIDSHRKDVAAWDNDKREYFDHEQEFKDEQKQVNLKISDLENKFAERRNKIEAAIRDVKDILRQVSDRVKSLQKALEDTEAFQSSSSCPQNQQAAEKTPTVKLLSDILRDLRDAIYSRQASMEAFKKSIISFKNNFSVQNTFHFRTDFNLDSDYIDFAAELNEFVSNRKIEDYRVRTSETYATIIQRISHEVSNLMNHISDIKGTIDDINKDFREHNFAGVIKNIELGTDQSNDPLMQQMLNIQRFADEHANDIGEMNLFSDEENRQKINALAVNLLMTLIDQLDAERKRDTITLTDTFKLRFKVKENDNDTGWVEKLSNVGSDGTDILVKAMVNIMLINVFKRKVSRKFGDFRLHCMMDEIGKLHPDNVRGILDFGNKRNILLINSSPTTYNAEAYRYTYSLSKDEYSNTIVKRLLTIR